MLATLPTALTHPEPALPRTATKAATRAKTSTTTARSTATAFRCGPVQCY